ncbi:MAG: DedA family protein, partial [Pseudomonadota bacterium]
MEYLLSADGSLLGLFVSSFLAATLLPGGSEAVLFAVVLRHPEQTAMALALATLGNTMGGMSTYLLARLLPRKQLPPRLAVLQRYGAATLVLAWAPLVGD